MVTLFFRLTEAGKVEIEISEPQQLDVVLQKGAVQAGIEIGDYLAVRDGNVIKGDTVVSEGDLVDIFPAISGG